jgi:hypothetical protein
MDSSDDGDVFKLFVGGIPPFLVFEMEFHSLFDLVEHHKNNQLFQKPNPATEVSLIGLVAHLKLFANISSQRMEKSPIAPMGHKLDLIIEQCRNLQNSD